MDLNPWPFNHESSTLTTCCSLFCELCLREHASCFWWASISLKWPHSPVARYCLQGREPSRQSPQDLGSIRLKICYTADYVFGSHYYQDLRSLLLSSADVEVLVFWGFFCVCSYSNCNSEGNVFRSSFKVVFVCVLYVGWVSVMWYWLIVVDSSQPYSDLLIDSEHQYILHYSDGLIELGNACASFRTVMFGYNDLKQEWLPAF